MNYSAASIGLLENQFLSTMHNFESKLQDALKQKDDDLTTKSTTIQSLSEEFQQFKQYILHSLREIKSMMLHLEDKIEGLEKYTRQNCLLIHGLKEVPNEDVNITLNAFFTNSVKMPGFNFDLKIVDTVHRIGQENTKKSNPRPLIVKFCKYQDRQTILSKKSLLKGTGYIITELLTKKQHFLYKQVKQVAAKNSTWTYGGRIYVTMPNHGKKIIHNFEDLEEFASQIKVMEGERKVDSGQNTCGNSSKIQTRSRTLGFSQAKS